MQRGIYSYNGVDLAANIFGIKYIWQEISRYKLTHEELKPTIWCSLILVLLQCKVTNLKENPRGFLPSGPQHLNKYSIDPLLALNKACIVSKPIVYILPHLFKFYLMCLVNEIKFTGTSTATIVDIEAEVKDIE